MITRATRHDNRRLRVEPPPCQSARVTIRLRYASLLACLAVCACAGRNDVASSGGLPPVPRDAAPSAYRVQIGDELAVRLYMTPELNEDVTVRPDGNVTTTLAQSIPAAGRTPEQVADALRAAYASELKDPTITVGVKSYAPERVYVAGEVPAPGELTTSGPRLTLLQAVARAGGVRVTGDTDGVLVVRRDSAGTPIVYAARYADAVSGRDPSADVVLQPYDVVIVPRTGIANVYVWVNQHIQQFVPVSWGFSYNVNPLIKH
jgi:polysaccharide export outer membrane protein